MYGETEKSCQTTSQARSSYGSLLHPAAKGTYSLQSVFLSPSIAKLLQQIYAIDRFDFL
ncbi:hypothetical protein [Bacillus subtilis]|uniref:hypothetical protein n=1 Tax=Bacillus subtilis TaxID=1423 RepID=UPI00145B5191|nr:hypothetical protein [Bacillus subtilis]